MNVFFIVAIAAFKHFNLFGVTKLEFDSLQPHPILQKLTYWGSHSPVASLFIQFILLLSVSTLKYTSAHTQITYQAKFLKMSFWTEA